MVGGSVFWGGMENERYGEMGVQEFRACAIRRTATHAGKANARTVGHLKKFITPIGS